jgi:multidrug transporter EmrE-like cation transporter
VALYYFSLAAAVLLGIAGQIALKSAAVAAPSITAQFLSPLTVVGLGIYVAAALCYIVALKRLPVSVAFPSVGASYAIVAVLAHLLWNEPLGWSQIGGIGLIWGGVLLLHVH